MATAISCSTKEKTNFVRLSRLLIDGGTRVLRDFFDKIHPQASLHSVLHSPTVHTTLKNLRSKRILTTQQWQLLYPSLSPATHVRSSDFDITLLFLLLRNICSLVPPSTGWDKLPLPSDHTKEADLVRLKFYRNNIFAHISESSIDDKDFVSCWNEIGSVVTRLGGARYQTEVERLRVASIDKKEEASYLRILEEWQDYEKNLQTCIKETEERVMERLDKNEERISEKLDEAEQRITDKLDEVREVLNRTVHSDGSQPPEEKPPASVTHYNITVKDNAQCVAGNQASSVSYVGLSSPSTSPADVQNNYVLKIGEKSYNLKTTTRWHTELQIKPVAFHMMPSIKTDDIFTSLIIQYGRKPLLHKKGEEPRNKQLDWYGKAFGIPVQRCQDIFTGANHPEKLNPKSILVIGKPGIGKTLFCQKLIRDWARNRLFDEDSKSEIPDFKFAYLLTFRQLSFHEDDTFNLMEFFNCSSLLEEYSLVDNVLFEYILHHKEEILVVLDGYDEYSKRDDIVSKSEEKYPNDPRIRMPVSAMCSKLIKGKMMRESVVLITSRPAEADELGGVSFDEYVEITGFSSKQVKEYIERYFQADEAVKNIIQEHIMGNENLVSFAHIPVLCFLMCWYMEWQVQSKSHLPASLPVTVTDLCSEVIQVFVQKHHSVLKERHDRLFEGRRASGTELLGSSLLQMFQKRRHSANTETLEDANVSPFQEKVLDKISKLAAKLLIENKLSFSIQDMESFGLTRQEIENLKASGLLQCGPTFRISAFEVAHSFSFTHLILHEYLAALWFVKKRFMPTKDMATGMVCQFMAGIMSLAKDRKLLEKLVNWIKTNPSLRKDQKQLLTAKCLYEFKDKEFAKMVVGNQYQRYCDDGNIVFLGITDVDCVLVSFLLDTFNSLSEMQAKNKKTLASLRKKPTLTLKTLYIGMSTLSLAGLQRISNSLKNEFCRVAEIETYDCGLRDDCGPCLGELLVKSKLTYLSLNENKLTDKTAALLGRCLKDQRCRLTRLYLNYNEISDVGAESLCKALLDPNCKLTRLVMCKNDVTDECKKSLMGLIEKHKPGFVLKL